MKSDLNILYRDATERPETTQTLGRISQHELQEIRYGNAVTETYATICSCRNEGADFLLDIRQKNGGFRRIQLAADNDTRTG